MIDATTATHHSLMREFAIQWNKSVTDDTANASKRILAGEAFAEQL